MPTRRGAAASATPGTLTGQISMSDVLLQALGDEASMDAAQFSQRVGDLFKEQPALGRGEGAPLSRQGSLGGGQSSGRSARITSANAAPFFFADSRRWMSAVRSVTSSCKS